VPKPVALVAHLVLLGVLVDKSLTQSFVQNLTVEHRFKLVDVQKSGIKATFDRVRAQLAQEAEQRSRPASRIYSDFRAIKA
jgi:uncharacterized protein (DUF111 family)